MHHNVPQQSFTIRFVSPLVSSVHIGLNAVPFQLIEQIKNNSELYYCFYSYIGPKSAIYNTLTKCVHIFRQPLDSLHAIVLDGIQPTCRYNATQMTKLYWGNKSCETDSELTLFDKLQIKHGSDKLHVYCPYLNITLQNITLNCPLDVFVLNAQQTFSIGPVTFTGKASSKKIVTKFVSDLSDEVSEKILPNHTSYTFYFKSISNKIHDITISENTTIDRFLNIGAHPCYVTMSTVIVLIIFILLVIFFFIKCYKLIKLCRNIAAIKAASATPETKVHFKARTKQVQVPSPSVENGQGQSQQSLNALHVFQIHAEPAN